MLDTLTSMTIPIIVLLILGSSTLGLGWWLSVKAENRDAWLFGEDETEHGTAKVIGHLNKDGTVTIVHSSYEPRQENPDE